MFTDPAWLDNKTSFNLCRQNTFQVSKFFNSFQSLFFSLLPILVDSNDKIANISKQLQQRSSLVPIFVTSSVTGRGLTQLTKFLGHLPSLWDSSVQILVFFEPVGCTYVNPTVEAIWRAGKIWSSELSSRSTLAPEKWKNENSWSTFERSNKTRREATNWARSGRKILQLYGASYQGKGRFNFLN